MTTTLANALDEALAALSTGDAAARRAALDAYVAAPMPARAAHLWRYTDPRRLAPDGLLHGTPPVLDGDVPEGVVVVDGAAATDPSLRPAGTSGGRFEHLVEAFRDGGFRVDVPARARVAAPVVLRHGSRGAGRFGCSLTRIEVGEGAEVSVVEEFLSPDGGEADSLLHSTTELVLAPGARLVHAVVNRLGPAVRASLVQRSHLGAGSSLTSVSVGLGGGLVKLESSAILAGPGARSEVLGAVFAGQRQHMDHHFFQDHVAPRTESFLLVRTALRDRARSSYTGRLRIVKEAPGCGAHQENRNLLLSPDARADSIPELEILTHDVQCSHAAATGPVDRDALFYLRSRGLTATEAERMVVLGFLEPVFARVPGESLSENLRVAAARRLEA